MSARAEKRPAGPDDEAGAVRRRQLLLFSVIAAVVLVAVAAWLGMGGGKAPAPAGGIDAGIVAPDAAEKVWTRRSEARLGQIETNMRQMQQEARTLRADNDRLRAKLERDAADARTVIDRQAAVIDELKRRMQPPAQPGNAQGNDPWFRGQQATPKGRQPHSAAPARGRMIETFELDGEPRSSAADPRSGPELVADAAAKPVSAWLPAGAHAEAVVLAGVDASAGVSSQGDPRPVLLRITGPAWTAAERGETETDLIVHGAARGARQTVTKQDVAEGRAGVAAQTGKPFEQHATENLPVVGDWLAGKLFGSAKNAVPDGTPGGKGKTGRVPDETGWGDSSP